MKEKYVSGEDIVVKDVYAYADTDTCCS